MTISDFYRQKWEKIKGEILKEPDSFVLGTSTDELVDYYFANNSLSPIEIDADRSESFEHRKQMRLVKAHERDGFYQRQGDIEFEFESLVIRIPVIPNDNIQLFRDLGTSTFSVSWSPDGLSLGTSEIAFQIDIKGYGFKHEEDKIQQDVQFQKSRIEEWIRWIRADVDKENRQLKDNLRTFIDSRKAKLSEDKDKVASLAQKINIALKKKEDEATKRVQLDHKPLIKRVRPTPTAPEEYVLDGSKVLDIISIVDNQGRQFEKTPKTYLGMNEEALRDIILVNLNSVFEGKATGETFSHRGKTDIYLNIDKGNILICECKIWGGKKVHHEAIDQLLSYLTWRNNFGIIIAFVRQKNFTKVLGEMQDVVSTHPSYRSGFKKINDAHFASQHVLQNDESKAVEVHHLFYNLY